MEKRYFSPRNPDQKRGDRRTAALKLRARIEHSRGQNGLARSDGVDYNGDSPGSEGGLGYQFTHQMAETDAFRLTKHEDDIAEAVIGGVQDHGIAAIAEQLLDEGRERGGRSVDMSLRVCTDRRTLLPSMADVEGATAGWNYTVQLKQLFVRLIFEACYALFPKAGSADSSFVDEAIKDKEAFSKIVNWVIEKIGLQGVTTLARLAPTLRENLSNKAAGPNAIVMKARHLLIYEDDQVRELGDSGVRKEEVFRQTAEPKLGPVTLVTDEILERVLEVAKRKNLSVKRLAKLIGKGSNSEPGTVGFTIDGEAKSAGLHELFVAYIQLSYLLSQLKVYAVELADKAISSAIKHVIAGTGLGKANTDYRRARTLGKVERNLRDPKNLFLSGVLARHETWSASKPTASARMTTQVPDLRLSYPKPPKVERTHPIPADARVVDLKAMEGGPERERMLKEVQELLFRHHSSQIDPSKQWGQGCVHHIPHVALESEKSGYIGSERELQRREAGEDPVTEVAQVESLEERIAKAKLARMLIGTPAEKVAPVLLGFFEVQGANTAKLAHRLRRLQNRADQGDEADLLREIEEALTEDPDSVDHEQLIVSAGDQLDMWGIGSRQFADMFAASKETGARFMTTEVQVSPGNNLSGQVHRRRYGYLGTQPPEKTRKGVKVFELLGRRLS